MHERPLVLWLARASAMAIAFFVVAPCLAQSLDSEVQRLLENDCADLGVPDGNNSFPGSLGPNLDTICEINTGPPSGSASGGGSAASPANDTSIARHRAEERLEDTRDGGVVEDDPRPGSAVDVFRSGALGVWASADFEDRAREVTDFEDGYDATILGGTLGADVGIGGVLVLGVAGEIQNADGSFRGGGGFDNDSYGGLAYGSLAPLPEAFVDFVVGYAWKEYEVDRSVAFDEEDDVGGGVLGRSLSGITSGDTDGETFQARGVAGYDFSHEGVSIGPRAGVAFTHTDIDGYTESGGTGLELIFDDRTRQSLQSTLGVNGSLTASGPFGVVVPEIGFEWVHEFQDDQRHYDARFFEDLRGPGQALVFQFQNEKPDRDFFNLNGGFSVVLPGGVQGFVHARTLLGHDYFDSFGLSAGVRVELGGGS